MEYRKCGYSGIFLPEISLGLWHNFGDVDSITEAESIMKYAFDNGICHFDLANNYGPPPGSAERNFGKIFKSNFLSHRDEIFVSSKAGHDMWPGVYGTGSSRKSIIASCDASLKRTGLEYFDVFYSHRYDGITPIEETMQALVDLVRSGKCLYVGISKYPVDKQLEAYRYLRSEKVPCLLSQYRFSIFDTKARDNNFDAAHDAGSGIICFSPLAQGLLTNKYLNGIPTNSRAAKSSGFLQINQVTEERLKAVKDLKEIADSKNISLSQLALNYVLADKRVTSVIIGVSSVAQLKENLVSFSNINFSEEECAKIDEISKRENISF